MQYSEDQVHDLLLLRRLFYGRQGQLDRQRKALVGELSSGEAVMTDDPPLSNYSAITSLAHELQANAAEGHCLRVQCCCACFRGVSECCVAYKSFGKAVIGRSTLATVSFLVQHHVRCVCITGAANVT